MTVSLSEATLAARREGVPTPVYDRRRTTTGVVHIGVGGFHRAHQAVYHDRLMNEGNALEWAICGVGLLPNDRRRIVIEVDGRHHYCDNAYTDDEKPSPRRYSELVAEVLAVIRELAAEGRDRVRGEELFRDPADERGAVR